MIVLALAGLVFVLAKPKHEGGRITIIREGDRAPEFRLPALDGRVVSLSDFRGKVVMVHFWATWCPPCVEEIPTLEHVYRSFFGKDFEILAVSVDADDQNSVGSFAQQKHLTMPILLNPDRSAAALYGTFRFPETYIIDRQGIVRTKIIGAMDWSRPEAVGIIAELLKK